MDPVTTTPPAVAIFGGSDCCEGDELFTIAEALGAACAAEGWAIVNGGYGGSMLAAARGAARHGGRVIGVTCTAFRSPPNAFVTETVQTRNLFERLERIITLAGAYIVLPGSTGTLAELALVWELVNKRQLPRRPILCWGDTWRPVVSVFSGDSTRDPRIDTAGLPDRRTELITFVYTVEKAVAILRGALGSP